jgi:dipeptidyl aminopeptidase/acylaminoacyl peptidase
MEAYRTITVYRCVQRAEMIGEPPMWVSHGTNDSLWEVQRSQRIVQARQAAGLPTEPHFWQGEDHILMNAQNRAAFAASLAMFMKTNLK